MTLNNEYAIIFGLDAHIGLQRNNQVTRRNFQENSAETAAIPPDSIDDLICSFHDNCAPIDYASIVKTTH
ncbi:hypothetical protein I4U23_005405 [Adineta vaga]|nr:hypothetical protein I4U23_005405 [Adineta vaga]